MKKLYKIILVIIISCGPTHMQGQTLGQDAEGNSSIVTPATTFNLDISNSLGIFAVNREFGVFETETPTSLETCCKSKDANCALSYLNALYDRESFLWGAELRGEVKDGIAVLFSEDKVASAASFGGVIGWKKSRTSIRKGAEKAICEAYIADDAIINAIQKLNQEAKGLINKVAIQTGMPAESFTPAGMTTDQELVLFYESQIGNLKNFRKEFYTTGTKIEEERQALAKLEMLDSLITLAMPVVAKDKGSDPILRRDIYENHYIPIHAHLAELLPASEFENPFDQAAWKTLQEAVSEALAIRSVKYSYLKSVHQGADTTEITGLTEVLTEILELYKARVSNGKDYINKVFNKNVSPASRLIYLRANFKNWDYKYDLANDSTMVDQRFVDRKFNGYTVEAGITFNFRKFHYFGLSTGWSYASNLLGLDTTTFKLQKQDSSITEGQFSSTTEIKALTGDFDSFSRYDLNCDYVYLLSLREKPETDDVATSTVYISINPYIRHRIYDHSTTLKNNTIIGMGLHAYNSNDNKIMGGLFVQTADAFGVHAGEESTFGRRITFGLIAKYNITGLNLEAKK